MACRSRRASPERGNGPCSLLSFLPAEGLEPWWSLVLPAGMRGLEWIWEDKALVQTL